MCIYIYIYIYTHLVDIVNSKSLNPIHEYLVGGPRGLHPGVQQLMLTLIILVPITLVILNGNNNICVIVIVIVYVNCYSDYC